MSKEIYVQWEDETVNAVSKTLQRSSDQLTWVDVFDLNQEGVKGTYIDVVEEPLPAKLHYRILATTLELEIVKEQPSPVFTIDTTQKEN